MRRRLGALIALAIGLTILPTTTATAGCYPSYGCTTPSYNLNLSTRKPHYMQDTKAVQYLLWDDGFNPGVQDGRFGPRTRDAVVRFQRHYGLVGDGVVGPLTWECLQVCPFGHRPWVQA